MDTLKLLLCIMTVFPYQSCLETTFRNNHDNNRQIQVNSKRNVQRSKIIEDDVSLGVEPKLISPNVDKTGVNIKISPKPTKVRTSAIKPKSNIARHKHPMSLDKINSSVNQAVGKNSSEKSAVKAINIPINLLLKDDDKEINHTKNETLKDIKLHSKQQEPEAKLSHDDNILKDVNHPKPVLTEEDTEEEPIKIVEDESVVQDELDVRLGQDCMDKVLNLVPIDDTMDDMNKFTHLKENENNINDLEVKNLKPKYDDNENIINMNYLTNDNKTMTEHIDSQATKIEILINHLPSNVTRNNPYSTIVIRNNSYHEILEPIYDYVPYAYNYYTADANRYKYKPYQSKQYHTQYPYQYNSVKYEDCPFCYPYPNVFTYKHINTKPRRVWKMWNNMDILINNPAGNFESYNNAVSDNRRKVSRSYD